MTLSKREKILVSILIGITVAGLYIFYLFLPKYDQYKENIERLTQEKEILVELQALQNDKKFKKEEQEIKLKWNQVEEAMPSSMKLSSLYTDLLFMRDSAHIQYKTLEFTMSDKSAGKVYEDGSYLATVDINIVLNGDYEDIENYLSLLYKSKRKLEISKISYKMVDEKVEANLIVNAFALVVEGLEQTQEIESISEQPNGKINPYN